MSRRSPFTALAIGLALAALAAPLANAAGVHGRVVVSDRGAFGRSDSLEATLGDRFRNDFMTDARITWEPRWDNWDFSFHYDISMDAGGGVKLAKDEAAYFPSPPPATLFDLTGKLYDQDNVLITHKIDRLALGYSTDNLVLRVGRQALTWGAGMVFHPMDLVDPFAPATVDTEYKPGVDMAYAQYLFKGGSDLQLIAVPRAKTQGGTVTWDASTVAAHYHAMLGDFGTTLMVAADHGDWTAALGVSGSLGGAVWNAEIVPTLEPSGTVRTSGLVNISSGITLFNRNASVFAEYYRNGFGVPGSGTAYSALPADLTDRLARGQVFNTSQDYLAAGMTIEWTPLLSMSRTLIVNLDDFSLFAAGELTWSVSDNTDIVVGTEIPIGAKGTEFGGLPVSGSGAPYVAPPTTAYIRLSQHF